MSRKPGIMVLTLILMATALNVLILIFNLTLPSRAAVAGMDYRALVTISILNGPCKQSFKSARPM